MLHLVSCYCTPVETTFAVDLMVKLEILLRALPCVLAVPLKEGRRELVEHTAAVHISADKEVPARCHASTSYTRYSYSPN